MEFQEIIAVVRDITFISVLLVGIIAILVVVLKTVSLLNSAKRMMRSTEEITSAISSRIAGPAAAGSGVAFGLGKAFAFLTGLRGKKKE